MKIQGGSKIERLMTSTVVCSLLLGILTGNGSLRSEAETRSFGRASFFTLNPQARVTGPVLTRDKDAEYYSSVFQLITLEAHHQAADSLAAGDDRLYWSFIVAALVLPFHESKLQHFRDLPVLGGECVPELNSGEVLDPRNGAEGKLSGDRLFDKYFKKGAVPFLLNCEEINRSTPARQLTVSVDLKSIGMMQVNMEAHEDDYMASQGFTSVSETIRLGIRVFREGFMELYRKSADSRFDCLRVDAGQDPLNYSRLIRGAWAGRYNSGKIGASCRFAESGSKWALNDQAFQKSLEQVLSGGSIYSQRLQGTELAAFKEIIENFASHTNRRENFDKVLGLAASLKATTRTASRFSVQGAGTQQPARRGTRPLVSVPSPKAPLVGDTLGSVVHEEGEEALLDPNMMAAITGDLNIRVKPSLTGAVCGVLPKGSRVQMVAREAGTGGESWTRIRLLDSTTGDYPICMTAQSLYVFSAWLRPAIEIPGVNQVLTGQVVGAFSVNVRENPPRGKIIEVVHQDDYVTVIGRKRVGPSNGESWFKLSTGGWVYGAYVQFGRDNP